jgi:hypothetical protein
MASLTDGCGCVDLVRREDLPHGLRPVQSLLLGHRDCGFELHLGCVICVYAVLFWRPCDGLTSFARGHTECLENVGHGLHWPAGILGWMNRKM